MRQRAAGGKQSDALEHNRRVRCAGGTQRIVDVFTAYRLSLLDQDGPRAATLDGRRHWTVPEQWFWSAALGGSAGPAIGWMVVSTQAGS